MPNGPNSGPYDSAFRGLHPPFPACLLVPPVGPLWYNPPFQISSYPSAPQTTPVHSRVQASVLWPMFWIGLRTATARPRTWHTLGT